MPPALLAARTREAGSHELLRYVGATVGLGVNTFGGAQEQYSIGGVPTCRVIQAFGDVYMAAEDGLYIKDDPTILTGTWTQVGAFVLPDTVETALRSGVFKVYINDVPHLCGFYETTTNNNQRGWTYNLVTSTFALGVATLVTVFDGAGYTDQIVYRNQIFTILTLINGSGDTDVLIYNPATDSYATVSVGGNVSPGACNFFIHGDQLQLVGYSGTNTVELRTYTGPAFTTLVEVAADTRTSSSTSSKIAAFSDGTDRFVICYDSNFYNGWAAWKIDGADAVTQITNIVIPPSLLSIVGRGGTFPASPLASLGRCRIVYDANTDPLNPEWWLYFAFNNTTGTTWSVFKWNGEAALIGNAGAPNDVGGDIAHALPFSVLDGGARIWTPGELDADMLLRENALGGEKLTCKGWGDVGPTDKVFKVYANKKGTADLFLCKLKGPITGGTAALNGGNDGIDNIEANPAVPYTFVVDFANTVPAIVAGERIQYYLDIS